ncbi:MAG: hypothetical protein JW753_10900 [Dehalococcoidia bacterium]|nr:hypothetical protein [Dehalococcoidia bacterium]
MPSFKRSINVRVGKKQVMYQMGYPKKREVRSAIASAVDECLRDAAGLIDARYLFTFENVLMVAHPAAVIRETLAFESHVISRLLEQCTKVIVFVATIGERLEDTARKAADEGNMLRSFALDATGSVAVEQVADHIQEMAGDVGRPWGLAASRRFSPGYCDWKIEQQSLLFDLADAHLIGVRLTDSGLMIPQKSVSGIIGLGPFDSNVQSYNPCPDCDRRECAGRR